VLDSFSNIDPSNPTSPVDVVTCSGTSNTVIFDLGSSVNITFPALFTGAAMSVTPTFLLPNLLSNDTVTTLTEAVGITVGELSLELSAVDLVPPFEIIPEVCVPYVGCTPALDFPGLSTDAIDIEEGPLYEQTFAEVSISNSSLFDGDRAPWILEGFSPIPGPAFLLNPNYAPVTLITGPGTRDEGQSPAIGAEVRHMTMTVTP
jgi:hypothetical protein